MAPAGRRSWRRVAVLAVAVAASSCSGGDDTGDTLGPLEGTPGTSAGDVVAADQTAVDPSASGESLSPAEAGSGFVSVQVRLGAVGVDETISLDRASVPADALDPISLDARCTGLDGGDGLDVVVVDLRRLTTGSRLLSVALHVDAPVDAAGEYAGTLQIGDADQVTTSYSGPVVVDAARTTGSFDMVGETGGTATGSFTCAAQPVVATTAPVNGGGEEIPGSAPVETTAPGALPASSVPSGP